MKPLTATRSIRLVVALYSVRNMILLSSITNEQGNSEAAIARLCTTTEGASLKRRDTLAESVGRLCQHQKRCRCCSAGLVARVTGCFGSPC